MKIGAIAAAFLAVLGISLAAAPSRAALVEADDPIFGARSITRDTASGLEWLDLTDTSFASYNQVVAQMGPGGRYEGWRYASMAEVETFFRHAGINDISSYPDTYAFTEANFDPVLALIELVGITYPYGCDMGECLKAGGITDLGADPDNLDTFVLVVGGADPDPDRYLWSASVQSCWGCLQVDYDVRIGNARLQDWIYASDGSAWEGSWLVRQTAATDIPEPGALLLLGGGLLALASLRFLRTQAGKAASDA